MSEANAKKEFLFGLIMLAFGGVYLALTMLLPRFGTIDSATIPYLLAVLMTALGIIQTAAAARRMAAAKREKAESPGRTVPAGADYRTVALTGLLIALYVFLLDAVGFPVMSALYLFAQMIVLTPSRLGKRYALYAIIAVIASAAVYYTFLYAFDLMLPDGELWYRIGLFA